MKKYFTIILALIFGFVGYAYAAEQDSVRDRLEKVADQTRELIKNAHESTLAKQVEARLFDERKDLLARRFPTRGDVNLYGDQRPWTQEYLLLLAMPRQTTWLTNSSWPSAQDAPSLRGLLECSNPAVRGLAIEALATLHEPEDVPRIAKLLNDQDESIPALGWNMIVSATLMPGDTTGRGDEGLDIERSWQPRRVCAYARAALELMTAQNLDAGNFEKWWARNQNGRQNGRQCVWFWQVRLRRDLAIAAASEIPDWHSASIGGTFETALKRYHENLALKFESVRKAVGKDLEKLPPEVEVKIRLLAVNRFSSALGSSLGEPLMGGFDCHRLSSERLLELLERKVLWEDVDWDRDNFNILVFQIAGQADRFFKREDVARLRAIQTREQDLWWNGQAQFVIGISKLLPAAPAGRLDDPNTRDGVLRSGVRQLSKGQAPDVFSRGAVARELVRTGLPGNWDFLADQFFGEQSNSCIPDMRGAILQEFGSRPFTGEKQDALARLLLDKRFEKLWVEPRAAMGADQHRMGAIRAVNAYAGKEILITEHDQRLADPTRSAEALTEVRKIVREALSGKRR